MCRFTRCITNPKTQRYPCMTDLGKQHPILVQIISQKNITWTEFSSVDMAIKEHVLYWTLIRLFISVHSSTTVLMCVILAIADIPRLKGWNAGHMTAAQWKQGRGEYLILHASTIGVCVPDRDQSSFILCLFSFFSTEQCNHFRLPHTLTFSRWMNFHAFFVSIGLCSWNWNYER